MRYRWTDSTSSEDSSNDSDNIQLHQPFGSSKKAMMENRFPKTRACLLIIPRFFGRIGQYLLHVCAVGYLALCDKAMWYLTADPAAERPVDFDAFDRSWQEFRRHCEQEAGRGQVLPAMPNDSLFGYFMEHLHQINDPHTVQPLESNGVLELRLKNGGLVVTTRDESDTSHDYVKGVRSLALCLLGDVLFWPYTLWYLGKVMELQVAVDEVFFFTGIVPYIIGLEIIAAEVRYLRRPLTCWRLLVLVFALIVARGWKTVTTLPWEE